MEGFCWVNESILTADALPQKRREEKKAKKAKKHKPQSPAQKSNGEDQASQVGIRLLTPWGDCSTEEQTRQDPQMFFLCEVREWRSASEPVPWRVLQPIRVSFVPNLPLYLHRKATLAFLPTSDNAKRTKSEQNKKGSKARSRQSVIKLAIIPTRANMGRRNEHTSCSFASAT